MRNFFIDLENVRSYGLEGILLLKPEDKVYVFYSDNANTLTIPTIESLNESSAQVKYIKTNYIGANAMDFQIVTLLGASIEKERTGRFYIISHDNGFKSAVKFCEGYFTGYDIVTGVFANILLAINSEGGKSTGNTVAPDKKEKTAKKDLPDNKIPVSDNSENPENPASQKKSRNRRRKRGGQGAAAENAAGNVTVKSTAAENTEAVQLSPAGQQTEAKSIKAASGNDIKQGRHRGKKQAQQERKAVNTSDSTDAAITDSTAEAGNAENDAQTASGNDREKSAGRNRRRRGKGKDNTLGIKADAAVTNESVQPADKAEGPDKVKNDIKQPDKSRHKEKSVQKPAVSTSQGVNGSYKYVYNALSDFLSQSTIDMYAAKIDEGIRKSANRNELHEFFKKSYGTDEAEALYKIIYSDFEKMKKEAAK